MDVPITTAIFIMNAPFYTSLVPPLIDILVTQDRGSPLSHGVLPEGRVHEIDLPGRGYLGMWAQVYDSGRELIDWSSWLCLGGATGAQKLVLRSLAPSGSHPSA
jgi:hypothetical protein